ncbi:protein-L-isoaspartate O-methyltransferase family protein [Novosphingobium sp. 9]|uniref:protein-L-isoaspartate O-methyltransferase family protein n=1 Tax=Novosphingobium sp. 9 TaxID=2025349 RepID=UPI0021B69B8C|nr:protein-L-isoaspartate O-methyltransferase [Novosphingobium sp. 9]
MTLTDTRSTASDTARRAMIVSQLRTSGVNEPWVLEAMASVAREDFVPADLRNVAYIDRALPLGNGRMLAAPLVHARLIADGRPTKADKALLIGDANGYLAALLRPLVGSLDVVAPDALASITGPADVTLVVIDGAIEVLPDVLSAQIAEGGRVSCGLMVRGVSRIATGTKVNGVVSLQQLAEMGIPALPEFAAPKRWSF